MRDRAKQAVDAHYGNTDCAMYNDFRELLARDDIDAVGIATLDSWQVVHALAAVRDGIGIGHVNRLPSMTPREAKNRVHFSETVCRCARFSV